MTWIGSLFERETLPLMDASLGFAHARQLNIMNNIANVETPYFKRRDVPEGEFQEALERAITERSVEHPASFSIHGHKDIDFDSSDYPHVRVNAAQEFGPERHDENSVVIEKEMADLAKNTLYIESLQRLYKKKLTMLQSSLRDRVA